MEGGGSKLPRIITEPDTPEADYDHEDNYNCNYNDGDGDEDDDYGRRSAGSLVDEDDDKEEELPHGSLVDEDDDKEELPHSGRTGLEPLAASSEDTSRRASASTSDTRDDYDDEEDEAFEQIDIADLDIGRYRHESRDDAGVKTAHQTALASDGLTANKATAAKTATTKAGKDTRPGTAVPESLEEAIRHYHAALEEAEKIGVETALNRITFNHNYDKKRDNKDELMELARHETLRRLTRLTSELFHRSLETKQIYQLVHETVMSTQARVKQLEKLLESYEILRRHKEEDEADLNALKERIRKVERIALQHAPLNDGGLLDAIEELKRSHIETQMKHKKRRRKEEMVAAGEAIAVSPNRSPSLMSITSSKSPRLP